MHCHIDLFNTYCYAMGFRDCVEMMSTPRSFVLFATYRLFTFLHQQFEEKCQDLLVSATDV